MIKLFRKIRQKMLIENKFSKYLLYAIGEIILVVIGILIALNLNTAKENKINDAKIKNILKEIQNDLEKDISSAKIVFDNYMFADSIQDLILNKKYTYKDYKTGTAYELGSSYHDFIIHTNGYDNLLRNMDNLPEKYKQLLPDLNQLYITQKSKIDVYNTRSRETVYEYVDFRFNQSWSREWNLRIPTKNAIDYFLYDAHYEGYLLNYMNDRVNVFRKSSLYRIDAIKNYKKIATLLQDTDSLPETISIKNKDTVAESNIIGTYSIIDSIGQGFPNEIEISKESNNLYFEARRGKGKLYWHKESIYFFNNFPILNFNKKDTLTFSLSIDGKAIFVKD